jgi:hypothetical protein
MLASGATTLEHADVMGATISEKKQRLRHGAPGAVVVVGGFIIFFCVFTLPRLPQSRAKMEAERILSLQAENSAYCEKWGFALGAQKHEACILDLQELRAKIDQRASDDVFP